MEAKLLMAENESVWARIARLRQSGTEKLAPKFKCNLLAMLEEARGDRLALSRVDGKTDSFLCLPRIHETLRSDELQAIYFQQGATKARTARYSWHFFGLAADVIHEEFEWFTGPAAKQRWPNAEDRARAARVFFEHLAEVGAKHNLAWGGHWSSFPDMPHFQHGKPMRSSPSNRARELYSQGGNLAVWREVSAV